MNKVIKFVKENKILTLCLGIIVLALIFLAIPGFAKFGLKGKKEYIYNPMGYKFLFGSVTSITPSADNIGHLVGAGVAIVVMLVVAAVGVVFSKKSSFVMMLTSLTLITVSILYFTMQKSAEKVYTAFTAYEKDLVVGWVNYLSGALVLIAGGLLMYKTVMVMKDEIKHPATPKGPSYNYLKK